MAQFAWKSVQQAAITAGGPDQDFTISGIGTPVAVIIECSRVTTAGTGVDHGILSCGASDGTTQLVGSVRHEDALGTLDTGRFAWSAGLVLIMDSAANTIDGQAHFKEWITDGVRITWDNFPAGAYLLTVTLIYGTHAEAKLVNLITSGIENEIDTISGVGFDPVIAMFWYFRLGFADPEASADNAFLHHGVAVDNEGTVEQWTVGLSDRDARGLGHGWGFGARDDAVLQDVTQNASGGVTFGTRLQVEDFVVGSGGVNVMTVAGVVSFNCMVLLLKTGGNRVSAKLVDVDSATTGTAGNKKIPATSPTGSWQPKLVRAVGTNLSYP